PHVTSHCPVHSLQVRGRKSLRINDDEIPHSRSGQDSDHRRTGAAASNHSHSRTPQPLLRGLPHQRTKSCSHVLARCHFPQHPARRLQLGCVIRDLPSHTDQRLHRQPFATISETPRKGQPPFRAALENQTAVR